MPVIPRGRNFMLVMYNVVKKKEELYNTLKMLRDVEWVLVSRSDGDKTLGCSHGLVCCADCWSYKILVRTNRLISVDGLAVIVDIGVDNISMVDLNRLYRLIKKISGEDPACLVYGIDYSKMSVEYCARRLLCNC